MPEQELTLETDNAELVTPDMDGAIKQAEEEVEKAETEEAAKTETTPAEGDAEETQETEETEETPTPPPIVAKHSPGMAEIWDTLNDSQRTKVLEDVVGRLDTSGRDTATPDTEATDRGGPSEDGGETREDTQPRIPEPLTEAEKASMLDYFGDEGPARLAFQKLLDRDEQWGTYLGDTLGLVNKTLEGFDGQLGSMTEERQLEQAMVDHADEIGDVNKEEWRAIADSAGKLVKGGRAGNYDDAVSLVMYESAKGKKPESEPKPEEKGDKRRRAQVARSLAGGSRRLGTNKPPRVLTLDDAEDQARADMK